jgi:hypothetical protein
VPLAEITKQGLASMALVVALLWGCILGERAIVHRADRETAQALQAMRSLQIHKQRQQPASQPGLRPRCARYTPA